MKVRIKGKEIILGGAALVKDLRSYYEKIVINSFAELPTDEVSELEFNSEVKRVVAKKHEFVEMMHQVTLVTEEQYKTMSKLLNPFSGFATVEELLSAMGVAASRRVKTTKSWWNIPQCSVRTLIEILGKYAVVPDGGAPVFFINFMGEIDMVDYVKSFTQTPLEIKGTVEHSGIDTEWMIKYPANLKIFSTSAESERVVDVELNKNLPWARRFISDNTGYFTDLVVQEFKNKYHRLLYSSEYFEASKLDKPVDVGQLIKVDTKLNLTYVVEMITIPIVESNQNINFKIRAICPPLGLK